MIQDMAEHFIRAKLSAAERNFRSRIAQLASGQWFLRGTLSERSSKCGKPNCRCAKGELHQSVYLVQSHAGKLREHDSEGPSEMAGERGCGRPSSLHQ